MQSRFVLESEMGSLPDTAIALDTAIRLILYALPTISEEDGFIGDNNVIKSLT